MQVDVRAVGADLAARGHTVGHSTVVDRVGGAAFVARLVDGGQ
jgi:hypothetical protein